MSCLHYVKLFHSTTSYTQNIEIRKKAGGNVQLRENYSVNFGKRSVQVDPAKNEVAARIDKNNDGQLSASELETFVHGGDQEGFTACNHSHRRGTESGDCKSLTGELLTSLLGGAGSVKAGYHSFEALIQEFDQLAEKNPNYVQRHVLGKTAEGRDIVAYKVTEGAQGDTSSKTGVVITGCHHAREWMTVEAPLKIAQDLLSNVDTDPAKQARLKDGEVWIVPCVNPDGYEYSRSKDNMWRKNRSPLGVDQLGRPTKEIGVDLNRNYGGDGSTAQATLWRPTGDTPGNTSDDFSATSDSPRSETYRGPAANSEPEVQALLKLELQPNIKATADIHSYGDDIFFPWDSSHEAPANIAVYKEICPKIAAAGGYTWAQGAELYLNSGDSTDTAHANGKLSLCFEIGRSFQPNPKLIPEITGKASASAQVYIDEVIRINKPAA